MTKTYLKILMGLIAAFVMLLKPAPAAFLEPDKWYERMREPWQPEEAGYIRDWLVLGEFPNPPHEGDKVYNHTEPCIGFDTDYLKEQGGEERITPSESMSLTRPDGSTAVWVRVTSPQNRIDFTQALPGRPHENAVAYGFATIHRDKAGQVLFALGSDDGAMVRVNGKLVHRVLVGRAMVPGSDLFSADLRAGENSILVKVEQGTGGWEFCLRLVDEAAVGILPWKEFNPSLESARNSATLTVRSDSFQETNREVRIDIVRAGGESIASKEVPRGQSVDFDTASWPDGTYEARCSIAFPFGEKKYRHLPWFKGDAQAAVQRLLDAARAADTRTEYGMVVTMLADMITDRLGGDTTNVPNDKIASIHSPLMEFEELELERTGHGSRIRPFGFVRLTYRDEVDDSPQFGRAYLPPDYDPTQRWPMIIYLHGRNPDNPEYIHWWAIDQRHQPRGESTGAIYIEPHGRGNTAYMGIGDRDVLRCIELAKKMFAVDDDRVYLTGESMGGGGTWHVGTRHPGLFAAIAPVFGGWDDRVSMPEDDYSRLTPLEKFRHESESSFVQAEDLLTTPVFVNHGDADTIVEVQWSRFIVREMQRWSYDIRYGEKPGGGHFGQSHWPAILDWLAAHTRNSHPRHVRIRAASLKDASAHWVRVEQRDNPFEMILVDAEVVAPSVVKLDSQNVLSLTLSPGGELLDPAKPLQVVWNGRRAPLTPRPDGSVTIRSEQLPDSPLLKRPELAGPIRDVKTTPFAIVLGTISPDPLMRTFCERRARAQVDDWQDWQKHMPRFFRDVDLSDADMAAYSLILVGGPDANAVTRKLIDRLPLRLDGDKIVIDGHSFSAPDSGMQMVYPNPLNRDRYVVVEAATSAAGMYHIGRIPDDFDFCISDGRREDTEAGRPQEKVLIAAGSFDSAWRVADRFLFRGDSEARAHSPTCKVPTHPDLAGLDSPAYLADVLEKKAVQCFQYLERNCNTRRQTLHLGDRDYARGIAVYPWSSPGFAEWDLSGGDWKHLRAVIGLEYNAPEKIPEGDRDKVRVRFTVKGDDRELYRSEPFGLASKPDEIDVPVSGVTNLQIVVHNEGGWSDAVKSANWADLRLER